MITRRIDAPRMALTWALCAALLAPLGVGAQGVGEVGLPLGTLAPPAQVEDLDGNTVQLLDYVRDRPALLEFWASWCENCEALQPQLDLIQEMYGDRLNVVAVAVAVSQSVRRVRRYLEEHDPGYPYLYDARGAAVRAYLAPATSVVVLLAADGRVVYTGVGPDQDLVGAVEALLGG
jgi:thiol-disulfide isomerase/thioredoxin